nr:MAG TPA: Erythromycin resistance leader peptide [Caudoviricetes sp.]
MRWRFPSLEQVFAQVKKFIFHLCKKLLEMVSIVGRFQCVVPEKEEHIADIHGGKHND